MASVLALRHPAAARGQGRFAIASRGCRKVRTRSDTKYRANTSRTEQDSALSLPPRQNRARCACRRLGPTVAPGANRSSGHCKHQSGQCGHDGVDTGTATSGVLQQFDPGRPIGSRAAASGGRRPQAEVRTGQNRSGQMAHAAWMQDWPAISVSFASRASAFAYPIVRRAQPVAVLWSPMANCG
jgi:hypothetical protein